MLFPIFFFFFWPIYSYKSLHSGERGNLKRLSSYLSTFETAFSISWRHWNSKVVLSVRLKKFCWCKHDQTFQKRGLINRFFWKNGCKLNFNSLLTIHNNAKFVSISSVFDMFQQMHGDWWNSSLSSEHLHRKRVKISSHDSLSSIQISSN